MTKSSSVKTFIFMTLPFLLVGCASNSDFWNPETCNNRLASDVDNIEEYQEKFAKEHEKMEYFARKGDSKNAELHKKNAENWRKSVEQRLAFHDGELTDLCGSEVFQSDLVTKIEEARQFLKTQKTVQTPDVEQMPDLRVIDIRSEFISSVPDEAYNCIGPYLDMTFVVKNEGGDFPRPIDLETTLKRTKDDHETLGFFTVSYDMDFGNGVKPGSVKVHRNDLIGGVLSAGATYEVPVRYRVENNQTSMVVSARINGTYFLQTGDYSKDNPYRQTIDIPIWDIYTESNQALPKEYSNGEASMESRVHITNKGQTATPGPVRGSFTIRYEEGGSSVVSWSGNTTVPIDIGGSG